MDKFTKACKDRVKHFSGIITEQSKRLGQWMDWDHSYYTNTDENIGGIWYFLKNVMSTDGFSVSISLCLGVLDAEHRYPSTK